MAEMQDRPKLDGELERLRAENEALRAELEESKQTLRKREAGFGAGTYLGTAWDITERKQMEESLRQTNERLQKVLEVEAVGVMFWDLTTGRLVDANDAFLRMMGYSRSDIEAQVLTWQKFTPPEYHEVSRAEVAKFLATGRVGPYEKEYFRKDGTRQWLLFAGSSLGGNSCVEFCVDISDRKRVEEALRASEQDFRMLAEAVPQLVWATRPDGWNTYFNQQWVNYTGMTMDESHGHGWNKPFHPDDRQRAWQAWQRAIKNNEPYSLECRLRRADGVYRWWLVRGAPMRDAKGEIVRWFGTCTDIEEIKQAAETIRRSESRLAAALEGGRMGLWEWDLHESRSVWNATEYQLLGLPVGEGTVPTNSFFDRVHPEDIGPFNQILDQVVRAGSDFYHEVRIRRADDGQERWMACAGRLYRDEAGKPLKMIGVNYDVTKRKQADEALRLSEEKFATAFANNPAAIALTRLEDGIFLDVNDTWVKLLGYSREEVIGRSARILPIWPTPRESARFVESLQKNGSIRGSEQAFRKRSGETFVAQLAAQLLVVHGEQAVLSTLVDITERKNAEEALAAAKHSAEQAKLAAETANQAKDHFLAVLSHELRNPLTPVLPSLAALDKLVPEEGREFLEIARRNVGLEARLIDDLLDVTRVARGKVELERDVVELSTILRHAIDVCRSDIEARRLHFGIEIDDAPHYIHADEARLQQVFWNLIKNAVKFTPHGGCVGVKAWRKDGRAIVQVIDSGVGIELEALPRIFNAFEQEARSITRQFGGLGLGLAISKALVELHGGAIRAHSEGKGRGATFIVELPIHGAQVMPGQPVPLSAAPPAARKLKVLLVEDHGDTARVMTRLLMAQGHTVKHAGDVATALEAALSEEFDVLLSDLGLPDGSGHDLMRKLTAAGKRMPAIAISGYGMAADVQQSREVGFAEHVTKPANTESLLAALSRVSGQSH